MGQWNHHVSILFPTTSRLELAEILLHQIVAETALRVIITRFNIFVGGTSNQHLFSFHLHEHITESTDHTTYHLCYCRLQQHFMEASDYVG